MFAAAQLLHDRPRSRRRVIVLISDGVDGGKKFNKVSYDDVIKALLGGEYFGLQHRGADGVSRAEDLADRSRALAADSLCGSFGRRGLSRDEGA